MSRPTSYDFPALRRAVRLGRAVAAAVAVGAALAGCTVTVEGTPQALPHTAPQPVAPQSAPRNPAPAPALPRIGEAGGQVAVYAEWVAEGWIPRPVLPVTDPDSGVSAWMFGTAEASPDAGAGGVTYRSLAAPASVVNWFGVFPVPVGYVADAEGGAQNSASAKNGRVVSMQPVTVSGHPGLDVRIEYQDERGRSLVDLIRYVELPQHLVGIESIGLSSDERVLQQVHAIMVDKLTIPTV